MLIIRTVHISTRRQQHLHRPRVPPPDCHVQLRAAVQSGVARVDARGVQVQRAVAEQHAEAAGVGGERRLDGGGDDGLDESVRVGFGVGR